MWWGFRRPLTLCHSLQPPNILLDAAGNAKLAGPLPPCLSPSPLASSTPLALAQPLEADTLEGRGGGDYKGTKTEGRSSFLTGPVLRVAEP